MEKALDTGYTINFIQCNLKRQVVKNACSQVMHTDQFTYVSPVVWAAYEAIMKTYIYIPVARQRNNIHYWIQSVQWSMGCRPKRGVTCSRCKASHLAFYSKEREHQLPGEWDTTLSSVKAERAQLLSSLSYSNIHVKWWIEHVTKLKNRISCACTFQACMKCAFITKQELKYTLSLVVCLTVCVHEREREHMKFQGNVMQLFHRLDQAQVGHWGQACQWCTKIFNVYMCCACKSVLNKKNLWHFKCVCVCEREREKERWERMREVRERVRERMRVERVRERLRVERGEWVKENIRSAKGVWCNPFLS